MAFKRRTDEEGTSWLTCGSCNGEEFTLSGSAGPYRFEFLGHLNLRDAQARQEGLRERDRAFGDSVATCTACGAEYTKDTPVDDGAEIPAAGVAPLELGPDDLPGAGDARSHKER